MATQKKKRSGKSGAEMRRDVEDPDNGSYYSPAGIRRFILEVQGEFQKIVWPAKKTTIGLTGFVILLVTVLSIYLGTVDLLLGKLVSFILH